MQKKQGFYIAAVYSEKASGVDTSRPELNRLIDDLQQGEWVIAERLDQITRLPPKEAEKLIEQITAKGAKLFVPDVFNFDDLSIYLGSEDSLPNYLMEPIIEAMQKMFLRMVLNISHQDWETRKERTKQGIALAKAQGKYKGRQKNEKLHDSIIKLRLQGITIAQIANSLNCSKSLVDKVLRKYRQDNLVKDHGDILS